MSDQSPVNRRLIMVLLATILLCAIVPALLWMFVLNPNLPAALPTPLP